MDREVEDLTESAGELFNDTAVPPVSEVAKVTRGTLPEVTRVVTVLGDSHANSFKVLSKKRFNADLKSGAQAFGYLRAVDVETLDRRIEHPECGESAAMTLKIGLAEQLHCTVLTNRFPVNIVVHDNGIPESVSEVDDTFLSLDVAVTFHLEDRSSKRSHESWFLIR
jgi:hypothetical protein